MNLSELNNEIELCKKCPELIEWCSSREGTKKKYSKYKYWGKPVPGFGDRNGELLIVGLAPGAHGANRTGRVFTGDTAGNYLYDVLYKFGYSNNNTSISRDDNLLLNNVYITNVVHCAPPKNTPTKDEIENCKCFLRQEITMLPNIKIILTLGEKAFKQIKSILRERNIDVGGLKFKHGNVYNLGPDYPYLIQSYHTSKININTKRISEEGLRSIFEKIQNIKNP